MNSPDSSAVTLVGDLSRPAFFDCSRRLKLRVSGADCFRFLNGQITNDLRKSRADSTIQASILNAKGKLSGHVFISKERDDVYLLDADPESGEELPARLERYIIADDVQVDDVTDQFSMFHFIGRAGPGAAASARVVASERFGSAGWDLWCSRAVAAQLQKSFLETFEFWDEVRAEIFRIERGVPRWGRELTGEIIPIEANLEATSIDYGKGCYIGQEVISRMKMSGQTNKRLCGLVSLSGRKLEPQMLLNSPGDSTRQVGWITSAARSLRLGREIALGFVKRGFNESGTRLLAAENEVEVAPLPFV